MARSRHFQTSADAATKVACHPIRVDAKAIAGAASRRTLRTVYPRPDRDGYLDFDPVCETMFQLVTSTLQQVSRGHEPPEDMVLFAGD